MQSNQKTQTLSESSSVNVLTEIFIAFATEIVIANEKKIALGVSRFKIHPKKKIPEKNKFNKPKNADVVSLAVNMLTEIFIAIVIEIVIANRKNNGKQV